MQPTELTTTTNGELSPIAALRDSFQTLGELLAEAGATRIPEFDLQKITVPASGGIAYVTTGADGKKESKETITCAILFVRDTRAYYEKPYEDSRGGPPQCYSNDGLVGMGTPGGACKPCKFNQFGSADRGGGKKCSEKKQLFILREDGGILPGVFMVPPTSLANFRQQVFMPLLDQTLRTSDALIEIGLDTRKNSNSSVATFKILRKLTPLEREVVTLYQREFRYLVSDDDKAPVNPISQTGNEGGAF